MNDPSSRQLFLSFPAAPFIFLHGVIIPLFICCWHKRKNRWLYPEPILFSTFLFLFVKNDSIFKDCV